MEIQRLASGGPFSFEADSSTRSLPCPPIRRDFYFYDATNQKDLASLRWFVSKAYGVRAAASDPPSAPTDLVLEELFASIVTFSWTAPAEPVSTYQVYRNGVPLNSTSDTNYSDGTAQPTTAYLYHVQSVADGIASAFSSALAVTTPANQAPVWAGSIATQQLIEGQAFSLDLNTLCDEPDTQAMTFALVSGAVPGLTLNGSVFSGAPSAPATTSVTFRAIDPFGLSANQAISFQVANSDTTPPTVPGTPTLVSRSNSDIAFAFTGSTDAHGVAFYSVYRANALAGPYALRESITTLSYTDQSLSAGTNYFYAVSATDTRGNESAKSGVLSTSTLSVDSIAPTIPQNAQALAASSSQLTLSWQASTDSGGSGLRGYRIYESNTGNSGTFAFLIEVATTSYARTGLGSATTRFYRVSAVDNANNESAGSPTFSGTTLTSGLVIPFVGNMEALGVQGSTNGPTYLTGTSATPVSTNALPQHYATSQTYISAYQLGFQPRPEAHPLGRSTTVSRHAVDYVTTQGGIAPDGYDLGPAPRGSSSGTPPQLPYDRCERRLIRSNEGSIPYDGKTFWWALRFILRKADCAPDSVKSMIMCQFHYEPDSSMVAGNPPSQPPMGLYAQFGGTAANPIVTLSVNAKYSEVRPTSNSTMQSVGPQSAGTVNLDHENDIVIAFLPGCRQTPTTNGLAAPTNIGADRVGRTRLWLNDVLQFDRFGGNCYNQDKMVYVKNGGYLALWRFLPQPLVTRRIIFFDEDRHDHTGNGSYDAVSPVTYQGARI
jgi:hypothetical protein